MRRVLAPALLAGLLLAAWPAMAQDDALLFRFDAATLREDPTRLRDLATGARDGLLRNVQPGDAASGLRGTGAGNDPFALRLDGVDDEIGTTLRERAPANLTLLVWVRTEWAGGKIAGFESSENGSSTQRDRQLYVDDDGRPHWGVFRSGGVVHAETRIADGEWHLLAGSLSTDGATARVSLHVDGALAAEATTSAAPSFDGYWRFASGSPGWANASRNGRFGGEIARAELHARPLDARGHAEAFAAGPSGLGGWPAAGARGVRLEDGLALALDPPRLEADALVDTSPYAQRVPIATLGTGALAPATAATGTDAIQLRGDGVLLTSRRFVDPDAFTLSVWFRTEQTGGKLVGFESSAEGTSTSYDRHLFMGRDGRVHFGVFSANGTISTPPGLADGKWHHLVAVAGSRGSDDGMRLYLDGALVNESPANDKPSYAGFWRVGGGTLGWADAWGTRYTGLLAGVRVYERALGEDEALALHQHGPAGAGPPRVAAPGAATLADGRVLHLDPASANATLDDLGPLAVPARMANVVPNATSGVVGTGTQEDPFAFAFDGVDDVLLTETRLPDPDAMTLSLWFQATKPGKLLGFESSSEGTSTTYDRHLFMDERGRLYFGIYTAGGTLHTEETYLDGRWHHVVATVGSRGGDEGMRLYVDGELVGSNDVVDKPSYSGHWRAGDGTLSWPNSTRDANFGGKLASILVHDRALDPAEVVALRELGPGGTRDLPALAAPPPETAERPSSPRISVSHTLTDDALTFTFDLEDVPDGANLHAVLEDGTTFEIDPSAPWTAPQRASGLYRFDALVEGDDGAMHVVASAQQLILLPLATPTQAAGAVVTGVAVTSLSALLASRGFDLLAYLRGVFMTSTADRLRDKTKDRADLARKLKLGSVAAMTLALVLWAVLYTAGKPGALALVPFARALAVAGLAVVAMKLMQTSLLYALARSDGHGARYRFWTAGTLSLALSSLAFHVPFGYPGFLQREKPKGAPTTTPRKDGLTGLATVCVLAAIVPIFLGVGLLTRFVFAETAMAMALGAFAVTAMPVKPMAGHAVWRWSRAASLALAAVAFGAYFAFQTGALPWWGLVALGGVGLGVVAGVAVANLAARRAHAAAAESPA